MSSRQKVLWFMTAFAPSRQKNITKTILFFANNLFPNVYIYGCTKKEAGESGTGEGKHSHTKNTAKTILPVTNSLPDCLLK